MLDLKEIEKMSDTQRFLRESLAPLVKQEIAAGLSAAAIDVARKALTEMLKDVSNQRVYFLEPEIELKLGVSGCKEIIRHYVAEMNALGKLIEEFRNAKPNPKVLAGPYTQLINIPPLLESLFEILKNSASFE